MDVENKKLLKFYVRNHRKMFTIITLNEEEQRILFNSNFQRLAIIKLIEAVGLKRPTQRRITSNDSLDDFVLHCAGNQSVSDC